MLRTAADAGNALAVVRLAKLRGKVDEAVAELHAAANGDIRAARQLAELLPEQGKVGEAEVVLRSAADTGDGLAAFQLTKLLAEHGKLDELRALADAGNFTAPARLARLLGKQGKSEELW